MPRKRRSSTRRRPLRQGRITPVRSCAFLIARALLPAGARSLSQALELLFARCCARDASPLFRGKFGARQKAFPVDRAHRFEPSRPRLPQMRRPPARPPSSEAGTSSAPATTPAVMTYVLIFVVGDRNDGIALVLCHASPFFREHCRRAHGGRKATAQRFHGTAQARSSQPNVHQKLAIRYSALRTLSAIPRQCGVLRR